MEEVTAHFKCEERAATEEGMLDLNGYCFICLATSSRPVTLGNGENDFEEEDLTQQASVAVNRVFHYLKVIPEEVWRKNVVEKNPILAPLLRRPEGHRALCKDCKKLLDKFLECHKVIETFQLELAARMKLICAKISPTLEEENNEVSKMLKEKMKGGHFVENFIRCQLNDELRKETFKQCSLLTKNELPKLVLKKLNVRDMPNTAQLPPQPSSSTLTPPTYEEEAGTSSSIDEGTSSSTTLIPGSANGISSSSHTFSSLSGNQNAGKAFPLRRPYGPKSIRKAKMAKMTSLTAPNFPPICLKQENAVVVDSSNGAGVLSTPPVPPPPVVVSTEELVQSTSTPSPKSSSNINSPKTDQPCPKSRKRSLRSYQAEVSTPSTEKENEEEEGISSNAKQIKLPSAEAIVKQEKAQDSPPPSSFSQTSPPRPTASSTVEKQLDGETVSVPETENCGSANVISFGFSFEAPGPSTSTSYNSSSSTLNNVNVNLSSSRRRVSFASSALNDADADNDSYDSDDSLFMPLSTAGQLGLINARLPFDLAKEPLMKALPVKEYLPCGLLSNHYKAENRLMRIRSRAEHENPLLPSMYDIHSDRKYKPGIREYELPFDIWCTGVMNARELIEKKRNKRNRVRKRRKSPEIKKRNKVAASHSDQEDEDEMEDGDDDVNNGATTSASTPAD